MVSCINTCVDNNALAKGTYRYITLQGDNIICNFNIDNILTNNSTTYATTPRIFTNTDIKLFTEEQ